MARQPTFPPRNEREEIMEEVKQKANGLFGIVKTAAVIIVRA